jgi:hypothetical protein
MGHRLLFPEPDTLVSTTGMVAAGRASTDAARRTLDGRAQAGPDTKPSFLTGITTSRSRLLKNLD